MTAYGPEWYDKAIRDPSSPHLAGAIEGPYGDLYGAVVRQLAQRRRRPNMIDIGCGSGRLANLIRPRTGLTTTYLGLDFSPGMIAEAVRYVGEREAGMTFAHFDCRNPEHLAILSSAYPQFEFVALEVLEHLDDDLAVLAAIPPGATITISVPSTDSASHVRHFPTKQSAWARYGGSRSPVTIGAHRQIPTPNGLGFWHLITARRRGKKPTPSKNGRHPQ